MIISFDSSIAHDRDCFHAAVSKLTIRQVCDLLGEEPRRALKTIAEHGPQIDWRSFQQLSNLGDGGLFYYLLLIHDLFAATMGIALLEDTTKPQYESTIVTIDYRTWGQLQEFLC